MKLPFSYNTIFTLKSDAEFNELACSLFRHQFEQNPVYRQFSTYLGVKPQQVKSIQQIPFLPVSFFKSHDIISQDQPEQTTFYSSGTTGSTLSRHVVADLSLYDESLLRGFEFAFGPVTDFSFFALLPSYHQNKNASLLYMVDALIRNSKNGGGFYLDNTDDLLRDIEVQKPHKKIMLIGVSYALLDLAEKKPDLHDIAIIETGGMKGRRKEMTKADLHKTLNAGFNTKVIGSEYGMTELLSQAWSKGDGIFTCPPWMKILTREMTDPFQYVDGLTGGINVIDLANVHSCAFIATQDLGIARGSDFEIAGRFDNADLRGCNLLVEGLKS